MASIKLYLDTRNKNASTFPLKIAVSHRGSTSYISTQIYLQKNQWSAQTQRIVNHARKTQLMSAAQSLLFDTQNALLTVQAVGGIRQLTASSLKAKIQQVMSKELPNKEQNTSKTIAAVFDEILSDKSKRASTRKTYINVLSNLHKFCENFDALHFEDIDKEWVRNFYCFLLQNVSENTARRYTLQLASVFNRAIDDEITQHYPFRNLKMPKLQTQHRALSLQQVRALASAQLSEHHAMVRDIFMLMIYLIGINISDLYALTDGVDSDGFISYYRNKTRRLYRIKVHSEASEIIRRYAGTDASSHTLCLAQYYSDVRSATVNLNAALKTIAKKINVTTRMPQQLTTYWARHTWATIAASLDIPKDVISEALGHSLGSAVTSIYIDFDKEKITQANRRVIDAITAK